MADRRERVGAMIERNIFLTNSMIMWRKNVQTGKITKITYCVQHVVMLYENAFITATVLVLSVLVQRFMTEILF